MTKKQLLTKLESKENVIRVLSKPELKEEFSGVKWYVINVLMETGENCALKKNIHFYEDIKNNKAYWVREDELKESLKRKQKQVNK